MLAITAKHSRWLLLQWNSIYRKQQTDKYAIIYCAECCAHATRRVALSRSLLAGTFNWFHYIVIIFHTCAHCNLAPGAQVYNILAFACLWCGRLKAALMLYHCLL